MKYMAIIDAEEKPVSCEFIGCNGNVAPYLIGATTDIKVLEQEPILDKIRANIEELKIEGNPHNICLKVHNSVLESVLRIIDEHKIGGGT